MCNTIFCFLIENHPTFVEYNFYNMKQSMKKEQFEFDELPFSTLERFGLTREMVEDLPMNVLDEICNGRHLPVLPVRVTDESGAQI